MTTTKNAGKKGGKSTLAKHGKEHFSKIATEAWAKRNEILKKFNIGELDNPVTKASVAEALENADKENV